MDGDGEEVGEGRDEGLVGVKNRLTCRHVEASLSSWLLPGALAVEDYIVCAPASVSALP